MTPRLLRVLLAGAIGAGSAVAALAGSVLLPVAARASDLVVRPPVVAPGDEVRVRGTCPEPVADPYVRATLGFESLDRYVVVPVEDGRFRTRIPAEAAGPLDGPEPGDELVLNASCATSDAFVAEVGTEQVRVVTSEAAEARQARLAQARGDATAVAADEGTTDEVSAAEPSESIPARVPLIAFGIAAIGTVAAFALSRRSDRRAAAMVGHPAQRGLGRDPRRARR